MSSPPGTEQEPADKPLLRTLSGEPVHPAPIWLMRQAGRYLPEYRRTRKAAGSFLDLCLTPDLASEVTLQPIRRYGFDAAILFSDILVVPYGLGQKVWFEEGTGPRLEALAGFSDLDRLELAGQAERLAPVYETLRMLSRLLPSEVTLIGFAGAPWTLASYMIEGGSSKDFLGVKRWAFGDPAGFERLIDLLTEACVQHLTAQIEAGAEVLQIFDSWAGVLPARGVLQWSLRPCRAIVERLAAAYPEVPVILFPRGVGPLYRDFAKQSGARALSLDSGLPLDWALTNLAQDVVLQGNLDPALLVVGGEPLSAAVEEILSRFAGRAHVFNLGHGILPQTPPEHVAALVARVREG